MEFVCEVIGYEFVFQPETGEHVGTRIFASRPVASDSTGDGTEAIREYINVKYVDYKPTIGDKLVFIKNQRGYTERIIKF